MENGKKNRLLAQGAIELNGGPFNCRRLAGQGTTRLPCGTTYRSLHSQGAIELNGGPFNCRRLAGQGATEYLVLLAVVLIIALVAIALLGFFPGLSSDEQAKQSQVYWKNAYPISIVDWSASYYSSGAMGAMSPGTLPKLVVRNTGTNSITITKIYGGSENIENIWVSYISVPLISTRYSLGPGEEKAFGTFATGTGAFTVGPTSETTTTVFLGAASSVCDNARTGESFIVKDFGFEYNETIEGVTITKRQFGTQPVMIKCS